MRLRRLLQKRLDSRDRISDPDRTTNPDPGAAAGCDPGLLDNDLQQLVQSIRKMPDLEPPEELLSSIMGTLRRQKRPWWQRASEWLRSPRSFRLSYLQIASLVAVLLLAPSLFTFYLGRQGGGNVSSAHHSRRVPVEFTLHLPQAQSVAVIGTFNDWHPQGYQMREAASRRGTWTLTLLLGAGRYEYSFLVNGHKLMADPRSAFYEEDGFGNRNAVLIVGNGDDKTI